MAGQINIEWGLVRWDGARQGNCLVQQELSTHDPVSLYLVAPSLIIKGGLGPTRRILMDVLFISLKRKPKSHTLNEL